MLNACTIIACNYLPFARVLADSFLAHHPGAAFTILLIDDEQGACATDDDRVEWRRLVDIGLDPVEIRRLAGIYDVTELATAVKPVLLRRLLDEGRGEVVYLDPDIRIYESIQEVADLAAAHGIVLTPHTMEPYPKDERQIDGFFVLAAGVYNLGFISVGQRARPFLDWWWETTRREALIEPTKMMFTDQRWVDFVPSFFDHHILKDPGYNVAYWNLHGRQFYADGDRYLVNGMPLRFFHFSGFDVRKPWLLSKHQGERPRVLLSERPALAKICHEYRQSLESAGINDENKPPYGWTQLPGGIKISTRMRRLYWSALVAAEQGKGVEPPSPFDERNPDGFVDWLNSPAEGGPRRVSRFLYSIYRDRVDVQAHFPDIYGKDGASFAQWIWGDGVTEEKIPEELLPPLDVPPPSKPPTDLQEGLNVAGYFRAELGIGEAARLLMNAIETAQIPLSTTTYDETLSRQTHPFTERSAKGARYDINVVCVNADSTPRFARDAGPAFFDGRHTAGYWFWEVEEFPTAMHPAFDVVDEVWTATDFIAEAVRKAGGKPVYTIPLPVPVPQYSPTITRARLGLPDRFTFLLIFDFLSIVERKNPHGLIEAFTRAFAPDEGPVLVLKSINGDLRLAELERLRAAAANRSDVWILDTYYSPEEKNALVGACDCYVSLHRSEGLGLTMAEAMALAKPVIATGYSGNLHFMNQENSYLVDYARVAVPSGCEPYPTTACWADPHLEQAAGFMREVFDRPDLAAERSRRAQRDVLERHNLQASARAVAARVDAIRRERRSRVSASPTGATGAEKTTAPGAAPPAVGVEQLEAVLPALSETAILRLSAGGRSLSGARLMAQRALFRLLRPLWFQQHQFHTHLVNALRLTAGALRSEKHERETIDNRLRDLTGRVLGARREIGRLGRSVQQIDERTQSAARLDARTNAVQHAQEEAGRRLNAAEAKIAAVASEIEAHAAAWASGLTSLTSSSGTFQTNAARHLDELTKAVQHTESDLATLSHRLFAAPYMSDRSRFLVKDDQGREQLGYRAGSGSRGEGYLGFEEVFRGPESVIRDRQRVYLPLLRQRSRVVDLGCGRGEMLDLLKEAGVAAVGVDADTDMVRYCRSKGHVVEQRDVVEFLREQAPHSIEAFFSAQVIEHLPFEVFKEFLALCRSRLSAGGVLIAETVNPHSLEAFKTFHTDLTHQRPIFPEVALTLCQLAGFEEARIMFPLGSGELEADRRSQGEYAVVAVSSR
jgi:glycosyltransferase involved in cell wall biosynthesis/2-polyprenyl-3-methyl-5-hydroxy-6-metoxy-1,4-benzoquinol methylase